MKTETKPYNHVDFLQNDSEIIDYFNDAFMDEDMDMFIIALGHVAKHKGIAQQATGTGLNRESLYKTLFCKSKPKLGNCAAQSQGVARAIESGGVGIWVMTVGRIGKAAVLKYDNRRKR